ncbi:MAG: hypothetical protein M3O50_18120 [Myxococcota bacterium]|nr:hypothetical protein [Myxococcota bacterium]
MRVIAHPEGRFLGYVQVKVASRVYSLPVESAPLAHEGSKLVAGFFAEATDKFGILVDSDASDGVQRATIERASADAARHIARKFLN